jgi:hypothetical protein
MNAQSGRTMEFKPWVQPETTDMRKALRELNKINVFAAKIMDRHIGSGDYEEFELRGKTELEIVYHGKIPGNVKSLIPHIIGKPRKFDEKYKIKVGNNGTQRYRISSEERSAILDYIQKHSVSMLEKEIRISKKILYFIKSSRSYMVTNAQLEKIKKFCSSHIA